MQTELNSMPAKAQPGKRSWKIWWQLTRPHTLTAAFVPVLIGTALALLDYEIDYLLFGAMLLACLIIQAATNMFNEYYDYKRGLDNEHSVGIGGAIVRHGVAPRKVMAIALSLYGFALLLGVYICASSSWWLAAVGLVSMLVGYLYTGGPYPIARTPFGEIVAGFFMGMLIILISFFIQAGIVTSTAIIVSVPIAILVGAILLSNSIRDIDEDTENGRKTLAILVGKKNAIILLALMFIVSYVWIIALVFATSLSPWLLLTFLSLPKPVKAVKGFIGKRLPIEMVPAMKATAQTNTLFGFLLAIGLFIGHFG